MVGGGSEVGGLPVLTSLRAPESEFSNGKESVRPVFRRWNSAYGPVESRSGGARNKVSQTRKIRRRRRFSLNNHLERALCLEKRTHIPPTRFEFFE